MIHTTRRMGRPHPERSAASGRERHTRGPHATRGGWVAAAAILATIALGARAEAGEWIVTRVGFSGLILSIAPGPAWGFAGPTAVVTTNAGDRLTGTAGGDMGSSGATGNADVGLCYRPSTNSFAPLTSFSGNHRPLFTPERRTYIAAATVVLGAGTWKVGLCVRNNSPVGLTISNNFNAIGWVEVTRPVFGG